MSALVRQHFPPISDPNVLFHVKNQLHYGARDLQIQNWFQESQAGRQSKGRQPRNFDFLQLMLDAHWWNLEVNCATKAANLRNIPSIASPWPRWSSYMPPPLSGKWSDGAIIMGDKQKDEEEWKLLLVPNDAWLMSVRQSLGLENMF